MNQQKQRNNKAKAVVAALVIFSVAATATFAVANNKNIHNGEKVANTYPIAEKNAIELIQERLKQKEASGELAKIEAEAKRRINENAFNLAPVEGLTATNKTSVRYYDPVYTVPENILDHEGRIIAVAGTKINPLEVSPIPFKMFFFDGREAKQIALAKQLAEQYGESFMPILVAGKWEELSKEMNQAVYYDQQGRMVASFKVNEVPSMVAQEGTRLRIEAMKP